MNEHTKILSELFKSIDKSEIKSILDAGSGKTSLGSLIKEFPDSEIDAIIYYNDERKKNSIKENIKSDKYSLYEMDIVKDTIGKEYDLGLAHLLLGEAIKWGNSFENLLDKLLKIKSKYLVIVDIKEDKSIDFEYLENKIKSKYNILKKTEIHKENPQEFDDFIAENYVGYVIRKK